MFMKIAIFFVFAVVLMNNEVEGRKFKNFKKFGNLLNNVSNPTVQMGTNLGDTVQIVQSTTQADFTRPSKSIFVGGAQAVTAGNGVASQVSSNGLGENAQAVSQSVGQAQGRVGMIAGNQVKLNGKKVSFSLGSNIANAGNSQAQGAVFATATNDDAKGSTFLTGTAQNLNTGDTAVTQGATFSG